MVVKDVVGVDPGSGQASINSAGKCMQIMWFSMQAGRAAHYHTDGSMAQYGSLLFAVLFIQETERTNECWCRPLRRSDAITPASSRTIERQTFSPRRCVDEDGALPRNTPILRTGTLIHRPQWSTRTRSVEWYPRGCGRPLCSVDGAWISGQQREPVPFEDMLSRT